MAAIDYLKKLPNIDGDRIAVVGASVGGNLACVASALYEVKTAVAISHKTSAIYNLAGRDELEFRSIYHLSSTGDQGGQRARWATELFEEKLPGDEPEELELVYWPLDDYQALLQQNDFNDARCYAALFLVL